MSDTKKLVDLEDIDWNTLVPAASAECTISIQDIISIGRGVKDPDWSMPDAIAG